MSGVTSHPAAPAATSSGDSSMYCRVWRWHFYAGLMCLPFLVLLALTGGLYLFKDPIESLVYRDLLTVTAHPAAGPDAETLVAAAVAAQPGQPVRYVAPSEPGRSVEVGVRSPSGDVVAVYLDPANGRVLGRLPDEQRLMTVVKHIHSLAIAGTVANHGVELVAGWAVVLVISGVFLWWPRGRKGGVLRVRGAPGQRLWWRDLHAVTGIFAAAAILFLAVTGMPWSAFWGEQFGRLTSTWGVGTPPYVWGGTPASRLPLAGLPAVPWALSERALPPSLPAPATGHGDHAPVVAAGPAAGGVPGDIGLDQALQAFARLGLPVGTPVRLPSGPQGVYTAMRFADDVRDLRVVHLDRYSGAVLADIRYQDYGAVGRVTEWGISLHTGRQFGLANQIVMLAGCLCILLLSVSAWVMWWKRRPRGRLAAPPRREGDRAALGALAVAGLLGLLYPLLGASMLVALVLDALVPPRLRQRVGL